MRLPRSITIGYAIFADQVYTPTLLRTHSTQLFDWTPLLLSERTRSTCPSCTSFVTILD